MEIQENDSLSRQELLKQLGISESTFRKNRERILDEMRTYYDFHIEKEKDHTIRFIFDQKFSPEEDYTYSRKTLQRIQKEQEEDKKLVR